MPGRHTIAIDVGRRHLRALEGTWDRNRLRVGRMLVEPLPAGVSPDDPAALGAWMGQALRRGGFGRANITVAVPREHVVIKPLSLPTVEADELPDMTRLALQRELPFDAQSAVIDFVRVTRGEKATGVQAVAAPGPLLAALRQAARSAGLGVGRISLRSMGTAALVGPTVGAVLAVDISSERVEFCVVVDGVIRFSRAGEVPQTDDPQALAEAVVTEARRTWMSYHVVEEAEDVREAVVIGEPRVSELVAGSIGDVIQGRSAVFDGHPRIDASKSAGDLGQLWPLAGLLLAPRLPAESIDLLHPRRAPDVASRRRRLAIAGAGAAAVAALGAVTLARLDLADLRRVNQDRQAERNAMRPAFERYGRDLFRLRHIEQWESIGPRWVEDFTKIAALLPPADRLVLDGCAAHLDAGPVRFDRATSRFAAPGERRLMIEGEAADRATADAFRGRLIAADAWEISTAGPDAGGGRRLPLAFNYNLRAARSSP
jgi:Tfp pilus assembly PilM family ATPase